jgi:branched-chain amino acid transport system ATP-binding protein
MKHSMLSLDDVHTFYGDSHILQGVTLEAGGGVVTTVLGRNGAGKTTLCRTIAGLTAARRGRVVFDGCDITRFAPHRICQRHLGSVPQGRRVFPSLSVREHLLIAARTPPAGRRSWDLERVIARFPRLGERQRHRGNELSGGEQQMLAIARALMGNPTLLIMDEPTEGLSPAMVAEVAALIRQLREEGTSVLLAEQNAAFAVTVADVVHVMSKGTIVHSSDPQTLWKDEGIKTQLLGVPGNARA